MELLHHLTHTKYSLQAQQAHTYYCLVWSDVKKKKSIATCETGYVPSRPIIDPAGQVTRRCFLPRSLLD